MKNAFVILLLAVFAGSLALPQSTTTAPKATPKTAQTTTAKKGKSSKKSGRPAAVSSRYRQAGPTPERYREIQQALVDKGYLKSEPSGVWDTQSADAMKQFQTDQKQAPTGKITSASLIGLGLGPRNNTAETASAAPQAAQ
jgi:Putative peptidoglycan binding domain